MPELPEAEANRARIEDGALNRTIVQMRVGNDVRHMDLPSPRDRAIFAGRQFTRTHRHGKYIFAGSADGPWMAVHLGMSGSLRVHDGDDAAPDYARLTVVFEGDRRLTFRCPRKFGWIKAIDTPQTFIAQTGLGPDAMQIDRAAFMSCIGGTRGAVKSALMAQGKLAGIGNLWSDEALFRAGIAPDARASDLGEGCVGTLFQAVRDVLQGVLDTNADYGKLPEGWLIHRREVGRACPRCNGEIAKKTVGGRTAYHCPTHQKET